MTSEQLEETIVDRKGQFSTVVMLVARVKKAKIILNFFANYFKFFLTKKKTPSPISTLKAGSSQGMPVPER